MLHTIQLLPWLVIGLLGLWAPGHFLQRMLVRRQDPAVSFVLSLWMLFTTVVLFEMCKVQITLGYVGSFLAALTACFWAVPRWYRRTHQQKSPAAPLDAEPPGLGDLPRQALIWTLAAAGFCTLVFIAALYAAPLNFYDFPIRWNLFPTLLYERENLAWYPVTMADDLAVYNLPDAMPQIVGVGVWWLYASCGSTALWISGLFALIQYLCVGWAVVCLVRAMGGTPRAQAAAGLLVMATPLVIRGIALRQEAGLLTLTMLVLFVSILQYKQPVYAPEDQPDDVVKDSRSAKIDGGMILACLLGGAAMSVREYAGFVLLPALLIMYRQTWSIRHSLALVVLSLCAGGLWYARVWWLTGNPFYTLEVPGVFASGAPVWTHVMYGVKSQVSGLYYSPGFRTMHLGLLAVNLLPVGLLVLVGLAAFKKQWPLVWSMLLMVFLWHWAGHASAGGYEFALRVLLPGLVVGVVLGVWLIDAKSVFSRGRVYPVLLACVFLLAIHACLMLLVDRYYPRVPVGEWLPRATAAISGDRPFEEARVFRAAVERFPDQLKGAKVLCTNVYISAHARGLPVRLIPPWSPEVSFLMDTGLSVEQKEARLGAQGIRYAILEPGDYFWFGSFQKAGLAEASLNTWQLRVPLSGAKGLYEIPSHVPPSGEKPAVAP